VDIVISPADIINPAGPFETTIASFTVQGGGAAWQGSFVGVSGMRLTRGSEKLELERRRGVERLDHRARERRRQGGRLKG